MVGYSMTTFFADENLPALVEASLGADFS